jgi:glycosyltransferase involved in cell wall biosynthesis
MEAAAVKVIISSGLGKLFFHETVREVAATGVEVEFITGWVPNSRMDYFVNGLGRLLGESSLANRMRARVIDIPGVTTRAIAWAEFSGRALGFLSKAKIVKELTTAGWGFEIAGWASRRYLRDANIFHVRSGAGQGGAIKTARAQGLKIITDQSIAHPEHMQEVLDAEYARAGLPSERFCDGGLWQVVLKDCDLADRLLVNSDFVKRTFVQKGYSADRIDVVYLGVRDSWFRIKQSYECLEPVKILFTGNFDLRKGTRTLLEAIRRVRSGGIDARLHVIGNMTNGQVLLKDSDMAFFTHTEFVPPAALRPALSESDMFVFPTLLEGCSRSAMEAAAAGLPVITTESCGLPLENGKSVLYVPLNDVDSLAEAIARLATNEKLRESLGRCASDTIAQHYTWPLYGEKLHRLYTDILKHI